VPGDLPEDSKAKPNGQERTGLQLGFFEGSLQQQGREQRLGGRNKY